MSLRTKLIILISGSVLIPFAVLAISLRLNAGFSSILSLRNTIQPSHRWRTVLGDRPLDKDNLDRELAMIPQQARIQVYDSGDHLLYGRSAAVETFDERVFTITVIIPVSFASGESGYVSIASPYTRIDPILSNNRTYVPLAGLLLMALIVVLVSQSINHSISILEKATRRIASGDLDFKLPIKGRDKFASLTKSFDEMREHLKDEYARRSLFMMGVSHDLKTPLASISGYISAIRDGYADNPEKLEKYAAIIQSKADLLQTQISMLIDFIKKDTHEWKLNLARSALAPLLREFAGVFEAEAAARQRRFRYEVDIPDDLQVSMDPDMVLRTLENLAQNAIQYSLPGNEIILEAGRRDDAIVISLSNEGPGIAAESIPYIFEPLMRGSPSRRDQGFGLGLAVVKSVVSAHGWEISVESKPDIQTVFAITIPLPRKVDRRGSREGR
jgi:signal transduction histidine kinase